MSKVAISLRGAKFMYAGPRDKLRKVVVIFSDFKKKKKLLLLLSSKSGNWGWREVSELRSTDYSFRGPRFKY